MQKYNDMLIEFHCACLFVLFLLEGLLWERPINFCGGNFLYYTY